jgi:lysophospholipid acyltransferase (LPLAT)-like uncharacterized protein
VLKRLLRHPASQALLAYLLGLYLWFALRTTRWRVEGAEHLAAHAQGPPFVTAFWHERLPLMTAGCLHARRMPEWRARGSRFYVLVSRHRDGRFIGIVLRRFDVDVVLGSSSRGGAASLRELLGLLAQGHHVVITPDGPRGPARQAAAGVAHIAALSGSPVLPCAAQTSRRWVLKTWDRMVVPKPFGRGVLVLGEPIRVTRGDWRRVLPVIAEALDTATERADRLCAT